MKIIRLYIDGYKNLRKFELNFEEGAAVNALIGNNGSGKSNVLEALTIIFAARYNDKPVGFTYDIVFHIDDSEYQVSNKDGDVFLKNQKEVAKNKRINCLPRGLFLYYCGETDRLRNIAISYVDKAFDKALKNDKEIALKYITYTGLREFPPAMLSNAAYKNSTFEKACDLIGIEDIGAPIVFHFHRPSAWGKSAPAETFWNAKGAVAAIIAKLLESGKMTEEEIIELYKLTAKQMQAIKERVTVMA